MWLQSELERLHYSGFTLCGPVNSPPRKRYPQEKMPLRIKSQAKASRVKSKDVCCVAQTQYNSAWLHALWASRLTSKKVKPSVMSAAQDQFGGRSKQIKVQRCLLFCTDKAEFSSSFIIFTH